MTRARGARRILLAAVLAFVATTAGRAAEPLAPGTKGFVLTALEGRRIDEIPVVYLGLQRDFLGPGYDLHLVRLDGPIAERVGVANGMSGSPVYFGGELLGALSYRLGTLPTEAVAGVTPFEDMLAADARGATAPALPSAAGAPIATPIQLGGIGGAARAWVLPQLEALGFVAVPGGGSQHDAVAGPALRPGSPVGAALVRGDIEIAATGTVTWVEGDRVWAFGHPFLGGGPVEMPMTDAEVVHTLADRAGSVKLARTGVDVGSIVEDRLTAIVGRIGRPARMIPFDLRIRGGDYGEQHLRFEVARSATLTPLLAAVSVANALGSNVGYDQRATMIARGRVSFEGLPDLALETAASSADGGDPSIAIAVALQQALAQVWNNPFRETAPRAIELDVEVESEVRAYRVEAVHYDRGPLRPGQTLAVTCVLRRYRGDTLTRRLELTIPVGLPADTRLALLVGPPAGIDRALGRPAARRLQTAGDVGTVIRALGEVGGADRLEALLVRRAPGIVSRGVAYPELPPSAERLLAARGATDGASRTVVSEVARTSLRMDGPIDGGIAVSLQLATDLEREQGEPPLPEPSAWFEAEDLRR